MEVTQSIRVVTAPLPPCRCSRAPPAAVLQHGPAACPPAPALPCGHASVQTSQGHLTPGHCPRGTLIALTTMPYSSIMPHLCHADTQGLPTARIAAPEQQGMTVMTAGNPSSTCAVHTLHRSKAARQEAGGGGGRSRHPGQVNRSASQARCSTMEVSRLLPLAGACGVVVVVRTPLIIVELLHSTEAVSTRPHPCPQPTGEAQLPLRRSHMSSHTSEQRPLQPEGKVAVSGLNSSCQMSSSNELEPVQDGEHARGDDDAHLPLARSATSGSRAASVAASVAARGCLSSVRVSTGCCAVAGVAAIRRLGLRVGLQYRSMDQNLCLSLAHSMHAGLGT